MPRWCIVVLAFALACGTTPARAADEVDLELVLAVDISLSMDFEELRLQREGYIAALRDPELVRAIRGGPNGRIAVTYVEWAGYGLSNVLVPWTVIDGEETARAVTQRLADAPTNRHRRTSISGALQTSLRLFGESPFQTRRRVIDISGDGPNNEGPRVADVREEVIRRGITINGLPILIRRQQAGWFDIENLDEYYEDCVIGGSGSFMLPVNGADDFTRAIRTKLIMEISGLVPPPRIVPASAESPRVSCEIGEQMNRRWYER